MGFTAEETFD